MVVLEIIMVLVGIGAVFLSFRISGNNSAPAGGGITKEELEEMLKKIENANKKYNTDIQVKAEEAIDSTDNKLGQILNEKIMGLSEYSQQILEKIEKKEQDGTFHVLPKKEVITLRKEMDRLNKFLGGIRDMKELPSAIFVIDPRKERIAIAEARKLNIPVFGIVDTNCDPEDVDYVIPANDDAIRAVRLIVGKMVDAIIEVNQGSAEEVATEEVVEEAVVAE